MMNCAMMIVLAAMTAANASPAVTKTAGDTGAAVTNGARQGISLLAKTWTTGVQGNEAGSQVLGNTSLTSPGSISAEGKGFEPSTGCPAPDFETLKSFYATPYLFTLYANMSTLSAQGLHKHIAWSGLRPAWLWPTAGWRPCLCPAVAHAPTPRRGSPLAR